MTSPYPSLLPPLSFIGPHCAGRFRPLDALSFFHPTQVLFSSLLFSTSFYQTSAPLRFPLAARSNPGSVESWGKRPSRCTPRRRVSSSTLARIMDGLCSYSALYEDRSRPCKKVKQPAAGPLRAEQMPLRLCFDPLWARERKEETFRSSRRFGGKVEERTSSGSPDLRARSEALEGFLTDRGMDRRAASTLCRKCKRHWNERRKTGREAFHQRQGHICDPSMAVARAESERNKRKREYSSEAKEGRQGRVAKEQKNKRKKGNVQKEREVRC
jgi:hypothetical protein